MDSKFKLGDRVSFVTAQGEFMWGEIVDVEQGLSWSSNNPPCLIEYVYQVKILYPLEYDSISLMENDLEFYLPKQTFNTGNDDEQV